MINLEEVMYEIAAASIEQLGFSPNILIISDKLHYQFNADCCNKGPRATPEDVAKFSNIVHSYADYYIDLYDQIMGNLAV